MAGKNKDNETAAADVDPGKLTPPAALRLSVSDVVAGLKSRLDEQASREVDAILDRSVGHPATPLDGAQPTPDWIRRANIAGINVRTIGTLWHVVNYSLTLPNAVNAIHLLPLWEPGVVASLYGMASWQLNEEFFDPSLAKEYPALDDTEKQLEAVVRLLHLQGRNVGIDVVPHTDRFSEIVLANPSYFEWLRRVDAEIVDHSSRLAQEVQEVLVSFVNERGSAHPTTPAQPERLFTDAVAEGERMRVLFGSPDDRDGRKARREQIIDLLYERGLETAPATMGPPYRGIRVNPTSRIEDSKGRVWYDYDFLDPQPASRAFGPLTRYVFFERKDDNWSWDVDFTRPRHEVFAYLGGHIAELVTRFGFDFMRGDMAHVQMRPEGLPADVDEYYDPLGFVKRRVRTEVPGFAYFAESFLAPPGSMAYGDEVDHLEASDAEATLGDLQSVPVNDEEFLQRLRRYRDIGDTRRLTPCFTVMTGDKDDPRFDSFYLRGSELRTFCAFFLTDMPSYTALGFELRDPHREPAPNEHYTKLYVFHEQDGAKATKGPYQFGSNFELFERLQTIRGAADTLLPRCTESAVHWLLPPDAKGKNRVLAWWLGRSPEPESPSLLCLANTDTEHSSLRLFVPPPPGRTRPPALLLRVGQSDQVETNESETGAVVLPGSTAVRFTFSPLAPGECRLYEWEDGRE